MKNNILYMTLLASSALCFTGCEDEGEFSKDYDINLPVSRILTLSEKEPFVDNEIYFTGENLNYVSSVNIGVYKFGINSVSAQGDTIRVTVPRIVESGTVTISNKYDREFVSDLIVLPRFYEAVVTKWPSEIQQGKTFTLKGDNVDLIQEVRVNGEVVNVSGSPSPESATYSTSGIDLKIGESVEIEVTPKSGTPQLSSEIKVVVPNEKYVPKQSLMLVDINDVFAVDQGDKYNSCTVETIDGYLGKAIRVTSPVGNGWDGIYLKLYCDNNGQGYDLSGYNDPHITMLINTNGGQGYVQPITYDGDNGEIDKHLTAVHGYGDDYKSVTNGWEWRSYSLSKLEFPVANGKADKIGVQFRGGNVGNGNDDAFEMELNMVMITDGPLNPTLAWDCESLTTGNFVLKDAVNSPLDGYCQGNSYIHFSNAISGGWDWMTDAYVDVDGLDEATYNNGIWLNMLINTGHNNGYAQIEVGQGGAGLTWMNFVGSQGYGDDYAFRPTDNKWEWRSVKFDPDAIGLDATQPFYIKVAATTGNWETGQYELNVDYIVFTTAPMDTNLNTDDL